MALENDVVQQYVTNQRGRALFSFFANNVDLKHLKGFFLPAEIKNSMLHQTCKQKIVSL